MVLLLRRTSVEEWHAKQRTMNVIFPCGGRWFGGGSGSSGGGVVEYCVAKIGEKIQGLSGSGLTTSISPIDFDLDQSNNTRTRQSISRELTARHVTVPSCQPSS